MARNTQMADKFKKAGFKPANSNNNQQRFASTKTYPPVTAWKEDGEDHINIWKHGKSKLGQALSPHSHLRFKHSIFGDFASMTNFWAYLHSVERDDRVRNMPAGALAQFERNLTQQRVTNFLAMIMDAHYQRVKQHPEIAKKLMQCTLPLDMYTVDRETGLPRRGSNFVWMLEGFDEIRNALIEDRAPDFGFLMDDKANDLYHHELARFKHLVRPITTGGDAKKAEPKGGRVAVLTTDRSNAEALLTFNELELKHVSDVEGGEPAVFASINVKPDQDQFYLRNIDAIAAKGVTHINANKREYRVLVTMVDLKRFISEEDFQKLVAIAPWFAEETPISMDLSFFLSKVEISISEENVGDELSEKIVARFSKNPVFTALKEDATDEQKTVFALLSELMAPVFDNTEFSVGQIGITLLESAKVDAEPEVVAEVQSEQVQEEQRPQGAALLQPKPVTEDVAVAEEQAL